MAKARDKNRRSQSATDKRVINNKNTTPPLRTLASGKVVGGETDSGWLE